MASAVPFARIGGRGKGVRIKKSAGLRGGSGFTTFAAIRRAKSPHIPRYCCSGCFGTILLHNVKRRKAWRGRHPFWLKSASVSKSTATCQPTATCRPNSDFLIFRLLGLASARIVRAFVFFEVRWREALLRGQIEEQAISKEVHRHPRRRRSLPAMRQSDANQGVCWPQRKRRTPSVILHPLVLLHE